MPKNLSAYKNYKELVIQFLPSLHDQFLVKTIQEQQEAKVSATVERVEPLIKADYKKSVSEVYRDVALEHINRTETLEILTAVQHQPNTPELPFPSWVPQWDLCLDTPTLGLYTSDHFASANRPAKVTHFTHDDPNTLIVCGTIVSKVVYVSTLCNKSSFGFTAVSDPDPASSNAIMSTWERTRLYIPHFRGEKYPRTVQLVTADGVAMFGPESDIVTEYMRTWVAGKSGAEVDNFNLAQDLYDYWGRLWPSAFEKKPPEDVLMRAERYRSSAAAVANQRKFFIVKKSLFGMGPGAMREGDWVAVLLGADVPFVLREVGGEQRPPSDPFPDDVKFQLVGECYVNGLMTGAAVKGVEVKRSIVLV